MKKDPGVTVSHNEFESLHKLVKRAPVALMFLNGPSFVIEIANESSLELLGKQREEVINKPALEVCPESAFIRKTLNAVFTTGEPYNDPGKAVTITRMGKQETFILDIKLEPVYSGSEITGVVAIVHDITALDTYRKTSQQNEMASFELLAQAAVGITVYEGTELRIRVANQSALAVWGKSREELVGKTVLEVSPEVDNSGALQVVREVLKTGVPFEGKELPILYLKAGTLYNGYFDVIYTPWRGADDKIKGVITVYIDVTHSVLSRQTVEESEERFRGTFENAAVGFAHVGFNGEWLRVNHRLCEIVGYTKEELVKKTFQQITHPDDLQKDLGLLSQLIAGTIPTYSMEKRYLKKDGRIVWVNLTVSVTSSRDGQSKYLISIVQDISEQKQAEDATKQSEEQFHTLADSIQNLAWMADAKGTVFWYNKRWYDYTGTTFEDMKEWGWKGVHHPQHVDRVMNFTNAAWMAGEPFELTFPLRAKTGDYRWFLTRVFPIKNERGEVTRWVGTNTDIEEQKLNEEKLEKLVEERTRELKRSNDDLQQFAHVASHDLKEPVRKIRTFANRLSKEFSPLVNDKAQLYMSKMDDAAARVQKMIDGVLLYSSLNATDKEMEDVNLNEVLGDIITDLEILIEEKGAVIDCDTLPHICGAPILLHQLFYNLVNNSLKFSRKEESPSIKITCSIVSNVQGEQVAVITLKDNGIGFRQSDAKTIFKPFSRLNNREKYEGTGLGLALCQKIVERHSGTITAKSEGVGAEFVVQLPVGNS
jgi:PAS domain S-box-containing protein